tara:strand:+ start:68 stop:1132 length:1065 start_codon:yes stop_codon:yes gene_type:complete
MEGNIHTGYWSIVLDHGIFGKYREHLNVNTDFKKSIFFFNSSKALLKITSPCQMLKYNGEIELADKLKNIDINSEFFCKYYAKKNKLDFLESDCKFIEDIKKMLSNTFLFLENPSFPIIYYFIENVGNIELHKILADISIGKNLFTEEKRVKEFSYHMMSAVSYLHYNNVCHFDIKPENIMYDNNPMKEFGKRFKIIDFGYAEEYPFNNYLNCGRVCGTEYYCPLPLIMRKDLDEINNSLVNINCNDWCNIEINNQKKVFHYCSQVGVSKFLLLKSDVYSLGMVIYQTVYLLEKHTFIFDKNKDKLKKFKKLLFQMLNPDINSRPNIFTCLESKVFSEFKMSERRKKRSCIFCC